MPEQTQEHKVHCITKSTTALSVTTEKKEYRGRSRGEDQGRVEWRRRADVRLGSDEPLGLCILIPAKTSSHHDIWDGHTRYAIKSNAIFFNIKIHKNLCQNYYKIKMHSAYSYNNDDNNSVYIVVYSVV